MMAKDMHKYGLFALNILLIALPLAILEVLFEGTHGWGSGWNKDRWYAKPFAPESKIVKFTVKALNIQTPLVYHFLVFVILIPLILIAELLLTRGSTGILLASYFAVLTFEDFFWFLINWNFDSLTQLTKGPNGSIWWHKRWIKISKDRYLPASYPGGLVLIIIFLVLANFI